MLALPEGIMDAAVDRRNRQRIVRARSAVGSLAAFLGTWGVRRRLWIKVQPGRLAFGPRAADRSSDAGSVRFEDDAARVHLSARPGCVP